MRSLAAVLAATALVPAGGWALQAGACLLTADSRRARHPICSAESPVPSDDAELPADSMDCSARIVSELVDTSGGDGKEALPDRFLMAVRAIRGEFSPPEGVADTERQEDSLTEALVTFPATVQLRVVSRPLEEEEVRRRPIAATPAGLALRAASP
jgi:hypothetical protein